MLLAAGFYRGIHWQPHQDHMTYFTTLFFYFAACPFSPPIPLLFFLLPPFPLSCQTWRPKTLLQHLRLRSSSGQMWRLALAQVSVQHPHTPRARFARFRCSAGGRLSPLAPLSLLSADGLSSLHPSIPTFSSLEINVPPLPASPVEPINSTSRSDSPNHKPEKQSQSNIS